ncbi:MAG TPA: hypothetical protein VFC82_10465 [Actinomycetaceae bacterium]|nr:hypothetical protein [Actinomycetaceae bacterium]
MTDPSRDPETAPNQIAANRPTSTSIETLRIVHRIATMTAAEPSGAAIAMSTAKATSATIAGERSHQP